MKIKDVIKMANMMEKGNVLEPEMAIFFLSELDGMIQSDMMLHAPEEVVSYTDQEQELLVRKPHDGIYLTYLVAMIRQCQGEFEGYNNAMESFNEKLKTFKRWYIQHYRPADTASRSYSGGTSADAFGFAYLTAYGLAVKHGYSGTEEEWLRSLEGAPGEAARMRYDADRKMIQWGVEGVWYDLFGLEELKDPVVEAMMDEVRALAEQVGRDKEVANQAANTAAGYATAAGGHAKTAADAAADALTQAGQANSASQQSNKYAYEALRHRQAAEEAAKRAEAANKPGQGGPGGAGNWDKLEGKPTYMQGAQEKFDPAWLPDGGVGWSETGEATVEWDGTTEGLDVVAVGSDTTLVRVSGLLPSFEAMAGRTVEMADGSSFEITAETAAQSGPVWVVYGPVGDDLLPVLYGVGVTEVDGITLPGTGLYAVLYPDQPYRFARVTVAYETVHRLDAKYLPEEAVREYVIDLDYDKTEVTSSSKNVLVGKIPNDLSAADINNAYASGQRLVVRLKIGDDGVAYMRLVGCGIRNWSFEVDMGSQYTADRIRKLYLELYQSEALSDTVIARVAYVQTVLGGDAEQVQADWGQNDSEAPDYVKDRTHWEENNQTVIEWDGNTEGREMLALTGDYEGAVCYKVHNNTPTQDELFGGVLGVDTGNGTEEVTITEEIFESTAGFNAVNCLFIGPLMIAYDTEISLLGETYTLQSTGIFAATYFRKLTYGSTIVHPLDEKFIPESIARKTDIPEPDTTLTQSGKAADAKAVGDALARAMENRAELICDITLEEEVQNITVSTDSNGNPLELERAYIQVFTGDNKAVDHGYGFFRVYIETQSGGIKNNGDIQVCNMSVNMVDNANVECHAVIGVLKPNIVEKFTMLRAGIYSNFTLNNYGRNSVLDVMPYNMDKIVSVALKTGGRYPVGTNIKIYKMG